MVAHQDLPVVLHNDKKGLLTIEDGHLDVLQLSKDGRPPKRLLSSPMRNFLRARLAPAAPGEKRRLDLHTLIAKGRHLRLSKMHVLVEPINQPEAEEWVETAMKAAYEVTKPFRRVLVLVNPVGGKGKSRAIVRNTVLPILEAAGCIVEVKETKHQLHAEEIVRDIDLVYDVIATASGDGLIYEVYNGLANRPDAKQALKIPLGPIPTGSANALCINLFGPKDTFNIELSCLNIIKGINTPKDLFSVLLTPSNTRRWGFLSVAIGLMVDLDIGTENMRWMGDTRFMVGFIRGLATNKNHKCRIRMKVVNEDKIEMARSAREWAASVTTKGKQSPAVGGGVDPLTNGVKKLQVSGLEGLEGQGGSKVNGEFKSKTVVEDGHNGTKDTKVDGNQGGFAEFKPLEPDESWTTIESGSKTSISQSQRDEVAASSGQSGGWINGEGVLYAFVGNMPYVARDLMQWPVATNGTGLLDIVVQSITPRATMISAITGAEKGDAYWMECQHYYQVSAFIIENLDPARQKIFAIDGEAFPYGAVHVKVYPGIANVLTLDGHFFIGDFLRRHEEKS